MNGDEQILALLFQRDEQALRLAEERYGRLCRGLARRMTGSDGDAEECVNDAYLALWHAVPPARPERLGAYLCRIVRNTALKRLEQQGAEKRGGGYRVALEELDDCFGGADTAETALEAHELARLLEGFLSTLTAENRALFLGRYWFAESGKALAARTGLTEKAVTVRLTRLRGKLKDYLAEREVFL